MRAKFSLLLFFACLLVISLFLFSTNPVPSPFDENTQALFIGYENRLELEFSETVFFHTNGVTVEITASNPNARIFYSLDGSIPTIYSAKYIEPLYFELRPELYSVVLRAIAIYEDVVSIPLTHTYFIGQNVHERFGTLVFSLSTTPDYLFDHDIGILVEGRIRERFMYARPDTAYRVWQLPANFMMRGHEWERPIHIEVFSYDGNRVHSQSAGIRAHGGATRTLLQKSLRLIARRDYSHDYGRFHFDFFYNEVAYDNSPMISTDRLILRNGGNDFTGGSVDRLSTGGMVRNELGSALAREAGLRVVTPFQPVAVFLNGEYYGFAWLQIRIDSHYLQDIFNAPTRNFDIVGDSELRVVVDCEQVLADINMKNAFAYKDLLNDDIFEELKTIVDIDNLLLYYAFQIVVGNADWPNNNVRRWRYNGDVHPELSSQLDGRWRYLVFDLDFTFNMEGFGRRIFQWVLMEDDSPRRSPLLINILTRPDMATQFTMIMNDLVANVINAQSVSEMLDSIFDEAVWNEISHWAIRRDRCLISLENEHQIINNFARYRDIYIFESLSEFFGFPMEMYIVNVIGGEAIIGTQRGTSSKYFNHLIVPISPVLPQFTAFDHWILNGVHIYEPNITVSLDDAIDGYVTLELVTRPSFPPLVIVNAYETHFGNGSALINLTGDTIRTQGLYLSNTSSNLQLWRLPSATIPPMGVLQFAGRNSIDFSHRFRIQKGFNIRQGQLLILSDESGRILDTFALRANSEPRDLSPFMP